MSLSKDVCMCNRHAALNDIACNRVHVLFDESRMIGEAIGITYPKMSNTHPQV